jgi:hypothetical protein
MAGWPERHTTFLLTGRAYAPTLAPIGSDASLRLLVPAGPPKGMLMKHFRAVGTPSTFSPASPPCTMPVLH